MYNLALNYVHGEGVKPDYKEAYFWAIAAQKHGIEQAGAIVDAVARMLPPAQAEEVRTKAYDWQPNEL